MKRVAMILVLAMMLSLTACFSSETDLPTAGVSASADPSGAPSGTPQESAAPSSEPSGTVPDESLPPADEIVLPERDIAGKKLTMMSWWTPPIDPDDPETLYNRFREWYGAELILETTAWEDLTTELYARVMSGTPPDIIMMRPGDWPGHALGDLLTPITQYFDLSSNLWKDDAGMIEWLKFNGEIYNVPTEVTNYLYVWYNQNIIDMYGLEPPRELLARGEWTFEKFREYAIMTTDLNSDIQVFGIAGQPWSLIWPILASLGTDVLKRNGDEYFLNLDDPRVNLAMQTLYDLYNTDNVVTDAVRGQRLFNNGQATFYMDGIWAGNTEPMLSMYQKGTISFIEFPRWDKNEPERLFATLNSFGVPRGVASVEASIAVIDAFKYNRLMFSEESHKRYGRSDEDIELIRQADAKAIFLDSLFDVFQPQIGALAWGVSINETPWATIKSEYAPPFQQAIDEFMARLSGAGE